jgi:ribonuclease HII
MKKVRKVCENTFEKEAWAQGKYICGLDEAGRGPLAGPLSVAAVVFPIGYVNEDIYDSKALSEKKREALYSVIMKDALWFEIMEVSREDIDFCNIYRADQTAMTRLSDNAPADLILTDAMKLPESEKQVTDIIKGDQKSISIAAASILAKVTRDHIMKAYDEMYPGYGFARNKGYGTKEHLAAIDELGITPIHRRSFAPVSHVQLKLDLF